MSIKKVGRSKTLLPTFLNLLEPLWVGNEVLVEGTKVQEFAQFALIAWIQRINVGARIMNSLS